MKLTVKNITSTALISALYTALTLIVAPLSFGPIQIRLSEALTVLPVVYPPAILGLTLGCFLSNFIGFASGINPIGLIDCAFGTVATLIAALLTYYIGKKMSGKKLFFLAPLPPVIVNAIIIGIELSIFLIGDTGITSIILTSIYVGLGQILPCYAGGFLILKKGKAFFDKHLNSR